MGAICYCSGFCSCQSFIQTLCLKSLLNVLCPSLGLSAFFFLAPLVWDSGAVFGAGCPPWPFSAFDPFCTTAFKVEYSVQSSHLVHGRYSNTHTCSIKTKHFLLALDNKLCDHSVLLRRFHASSEININGTTIELPEN